MDCEWCESVQHTLMTFTAYNNVLGHELSLRVGCAIAQEVSHCHPTVGSIPRSQREFVVDKVVLGHVFSKYFSFPCSTLI
jgi:hypothetical protein